MLHNNFFNLFCEKFFDDEIKRVCYDVIDKVDAGFSDDYKEIIDMFMYPECGNFKETVDRLISLANKMNVNDYTLNTVFFISCGEILRERYKEAGRSDELFWDTIADIKYKTLECVFCKDIIGIFVPLWFGGIFNMSLVQLGRFQYHKIAFTTDFTTKSGFELHKGDPIYNMHIPAYNGPLTTESCIDSFKLAYKYFKEKNDFEGDTMVIKCGSWLFNPDHPKILPEDMNIMKFYNMFEMYETYEPNDYLAEEGCRFFGNCFGMKYEDLPEDTRLQRIYKKYLLEGNKPVNGRGILLFDGEKIIN